MRKYLLLLLFCLFSFSAIHAENKWESEPDGTEWYLSVDGTLTVSKEGDMSNYPEGETPWNRQRNDIKKIVIKEGVTRIGDYAFAGCRNLTSVEIPNSVKSIGVRSFVECINLPSIEIPNSVTSIEEQAFSFCDGLTSIEIPNSVTSIGEQAFYNCYYLASVTIGNSVTDIAKEAFCALPALTSITFKGSNPPKFGENVFKAANENVSVYVPANSIEEYKTKLGGLSSKVKGAIILADDEAYTRESDAEGVAAFYTRNFTNVNWQALYLPFSLKYEDWKDDFEIAYISAVRQRDKNDDGKIDETILEFVKLNSGSTAPNTPYIIRAKETGEKTLSAQNTTLYKAEINSVDCSTTAAKFIFTGTYIPTAFLPSRPYYALSSNKLERLNATAVYPYQWYMKIESRNSGYGVYSSGVISGINSERITIRVLDEAEVEVPMVVNAEYKWATFCAPFDVTIPEGVTAYTVDGVKDETERTLDMTEVKTTIPANTPVVLYSATGVNETFTGNPNYNDKPKAGKLFGVYEEKMTFEDYPNDAIYLLSRPAGYTKVAFYPVDKEYKEPTPTAAGGYTTYNMQYKAFLNLSAGDEAYPAPLGARGFFFSTEDAEATAMEGVEVLTNGDYDAIYNAAGIQVDALEKGLNIVVKDGKDYKIYVK